MLKKTLMVLLLFSSCVSLIGCKSDKKTESKKIIKNVYFMTDAVFCDWGDSNKAPEDYYQEKENLSFESLSSSEGVSFNEDYEFSLFFEVEETITIKKISFDIAIDAEKRDSYLRIGAFRNDLPLEGNTTRRQKYDFTIADDYVGSTFSISQTLSTPVKVYEGSYLTVSLLESNISNLKIEID